MAAGGGGGPRSLLGSAKGLIRQSPSTGVHSREETNPGRSRKDGPPAGAHASEKATSWWEDEAVLSPPAAWLFSAVRKASPEGEECSQRGKGTVWEPAPRLEVRQPLETSGMNRKPFWASAGAEADGSSPVSAGPPASWHSCSQFLGTTGSVRRRKSCSGQR